MRRGFWIVSCVYWRWKKVSFFRVIWFMTHLCVDEVEDVGGFPSIILPHNDDEALIRHEDTSLIEFKCTNVDDDSSKQQTMHLGRRGISNNSLGWCFKRNFNPFYDCDTMILQITFSHVDTGAILELRLPPRSKDDNPANAHEEENEQYNNPCPYILDGPQEDESSNNYEDDGFVVMEEEEYDNDLCKICSKPGELIVCDGGVHHEGCNNSFHIACIGLDKIPPG